MQNLHIGESDAQPRQLKKRQDREEECSSSASRSTLFENSLFTTVQHSGIFSILIWSFLNCLKKLFCSCTSFWFWDRRPDIYAILFSSWLKIATHDDETEWHKLCLTWLLGRYILTWLVMIDILLKCTIGEEGYVPQRRLTRRGLCSGWMWGGKTDNGLKRNCVESKRTRWKKANIVHNKSKMSQCIEQILFVCRAFSVVLLTSLVLTQQQMGKRRQLQRI